MSRPHKCPVCDGEGQRPNPGGTAAFKDCRTCVGTGIVWEPAPEIHYVNIGGLQIPVTPPPPWVVTS